MVFKGLYSEVYDAFNESKDYSKEARFVLDVHEKFSEKESIQDILDFGCGSGLHLNSLLKMVGSANSAIGVDASEFLCNIATKSADQKTKIVHSKIADFRHELKFDLIISLFHVINYQHTVEDLLQFMQAIKRNLQPNGLTLIDFWNLAAWINEPPSRRTKDVKSKGYLYKRTSIPLVDFSQGTVQLQIIVEKVSLQTDALIERSVEVHSLRAFSQLELDLACRQSGLKLLSVGPWMDLSRPLKEKDWYAYAAITHA